MKPTPPMDFSLNKLVSIIGLLATASFYFYFIGLLYEEAYFFYLSVPLSTNSYDYREYVVVGIFLLLQFSLMFTPIIIDKILVVRKIKIILYRSGKAQDSNAKNEIEALDLINKLSPGPDLNRAKTLLEEILNDKEEIKKEIKKTKDLEKRFLSNWDSNKERWIFVFLAILYALINFGLEYYFLHVVSFSSAINILYIAFGYFPYVMLKKYYEDEQWGFDKIIIPLFFFIIIVSILFPIVKGILNARRDVQHDSFAKITIVIDNKLYQAVYLSSDSEFYVLKMQNKIISIPINKIQEITWVDTFKSRMYKAM